MIVAIRAPARTGSAFVTRGTSGRTAATRGVRNAKTKASVTSKQECAIVKTTGEE